MKKTLLFSVILMALSFGALARDKDATPSADKSSAGKSVTIRKTQTVDFEGDTVDGQARHPDGAYLVQKRSVDFVPLYKVREKFDENIKGSIDYLK